MTHWPAYLTLAIVAIFALAINAPEQASANPIQYLPWTAGDTWNVIQGNNGSFSHNDSFNRYAWDFQKIGDATDQSIRAAAGGKVVKVINSVAGSSWDGQRCTSYEANQVLLDHHDGTYGLYLHLRQEKGGVPPTGDNSWVTEDQEIARGTVIGRVGMTGCAKGPHLHYSLMSKDNSGSLFSIPSSFAEVATNSGVPQEGQDYTSQNIPLINKVVDVGFPGRLYTFYTCTPGFIRVVLISSDDSEDELFYKQGNGGERQATRWLWPGQYTLRVFFTGTPNGEPPDIGWSFL